MARNLSRRLKKVVAGVLAVLIVAGAVPAELGGVRLFDTAITASAATEVASGTCGVNAFWSLDDEGKMTISGTGAMLDYEFTETPWHHYLTNNIKTVEIANGITHIGENTFCYGTSLKSVSIPASVTSIGDYAFNGCGALEEVTFASGSKLETIGQYAFSCKSLKSVSIPASVTSIDQGAFDYCKSLKSVTIPEGVTTIAAHAFRECTSLESVTIPDSVTTISQYAFYKCSSLTSVTIPDSVTTISQYAFCHCSSLTSVTIPANVTSIGLSAFEDCSALAALTFASGSKLTTIGHYAFSNCTSLTSVTIPEGVISIGDWLFDGCTSLVSVTIPSSLKEISYCAFQNCTAFTSVTIPASVTKIVADAFLKCTNITDVYCLANPADLTWHDVGCDDFIETPAKTTKCHVPANYLDDYNSQFNKGEDTDINVTFVGDLCLCGDTAYWTLTDTDDDGVKDKLTIGGTGAMWDYNGLDNAAPWYDSIENIKTVEIKSGITTIGDYAFINGYNLSSVTIPESTTSIGKTAFESCISLESVSIPESVTTIGESAFFECTSLTSVNIPENLTSINEYTFGFCTALKSVNIPKSVTSIGKKAFCFCTSFESVTIPASVTSIGEDAFFGCTSITDVYCLANPADLEWIESGNNNLYFIKTPAKTTRCHVPAAYLAAYKENFDYINVTFVADLCGDHATWTLTDTDDDGVEDKLTIGGTGDMWDYEYVSDNIGWTNTPWHEYYNSIESVEIAESITKIGKNAFGSFTNEAFTSVTIPASVTSIGEDAFCQCISLESVTIPASVTRINADAFNGCTNITDVYCLADPDDLAWNEIECDDFIETPAKTTKCHVPAAYLADYNAKYNKGDYSDVNVTFVADLCGDSAYWTLTDTDNDGVKDKLTIGGTGAMYDYEYNTTPWYSDRANIKSVEIASGITKIGNHAFDSFTNEAFTSVTIPASVTSIGENAFYYCISLESVTIPEGVTTIAKRAFRECTSLESVTIPASVTKIEADAFYCCTNITDVYCLANPADLTWTDDGCDDFIETPAKTTKCHVAKGTVAAYKAKFGKTVNVTFVVDLTVTVADGITNGTVTANKTAALSGDEITLTVTPAEHYKLKTLTVTDAAGSPVTVTDNKFTMPDSDVTVSAEFEQITYTLQFDPNGGTQNMASLTVGEGDSFVFPECTITPPANKQFLYWEMTGTDGLYFKDSTEIIAKIFADPNGIITVTAYWEYAPTVLKTAPSAGAITYGQTLADSTLTGGEVTANGTAVAGKFAWSAPDTKPAVSDSESTEYEVTFTPDNTELSAVRTKIKVKVDPAEQTVTAEGYSGTYDGSEHGITVTPADQNAVVYYSETQLTAENYTSGSSTSPKFSAAGNHPVYYYVVLPNYKPVSGSENVVIARAAASVTVTGHINTEVYDGEEHTVSGYDVEISNPLYTKTDLVFSGTAEAKRTDVGTTSMGLSKSQFANSNTNFDVTFSVYDGSQEIVEKNVTLPAVELQYDSVTYDGSEKKPSVSVKDGEKVIPESEYTVSYSNNINAGTATVTVTDKDGGNYTVSGSKTFKITQAPQDAPAADSFTVSDETVSGKADGKIEGLTDKMEISTSADDGFKAVTDASGDNLAAGTYYVRFAADDNHTASEALELTVNAGRKLTVRFVNEDGAELQTGEYDYNGVPEYRGETPEKAADAEYTYTFKEWDKELAAATEDADYIATYDSAKNSYTITFDTDGGSEIVPITQEWGTEISAPEAPTKDGYTFAGWDKDIPSTMPTENVTVKAKWVKNEYTVSFNNAVVNDVDWVHGSTDPLLVVVNGTPDDTLTFDYFEALLVDGSPVDSGSYSKEKGSLKLTLNADYLNTLSVGEHNMQIVFKDNTADCRLTVLPEPTTDSPTQSNNPTTGTSDPFGALALITAASLTALDLIGRKRKKEDQAENK